jgi:signal transduction histidine kinase
VNEKQQDALSKALDSGRHLLALINDVLDMTKIEAGLLKLFVEADIDLNPELNAAIAATKTLFSDKRVAFVQDIDADLPLIVGDRRRIRQVLLNLLSNAAKFTDEGSVQLSVKKREGELLFSVRDTGPGIAPDDQTVIFEPFKQTDAGIRHAGGTGLGLPISKRLVEAHGGKLWVESTPGEGSAFYYTLPVRAPELLNAMSLPVNG